MLAFKIFQAFLSPSIFLLIILVLGLFFLKKKFGKILIIIGVILYYFFSITPIADLIISPLENQYPAHLAFSEEGAELNGQEHKPEFIVLLIGGIKRGDLPSSSKLGESTLFRTVKAVEVYFELAHRPKIIISGTDPIFPSRQPANKIAEFIQSLNIPKESIILEEKSKNTYQSAQELKEIIGDESFVLITSAYHLPRSVYIFRKVGLAPIPIPADFKAEEDYNVLDFFPDPKNLRKCNLAFHEYFGILYYYFK